MSEFEFLKYLKSGAVATIVLSNPKKANSIGEKMWFEIGTAFRQISKDADLKVCIIKSESKHFTSGIDIGFLDSIVSKCQQKPENERQEFLRTTIIEMQDSFSEVENCPIPVIAQVHGVCIGAGVDLISACDLRFSTKSSFFSIMETRLGIVADMGTLQRLPNTIPEGILKELTYSSKIFSGRYAEKIGLVNKSFFTKKSLDSHIRKLADTICSMPSYAVKGSKLTINYARENTVNAGLKQIAELNSRLLLSDEALSTFSAVKNQFNKPKGK